MQQLLHSHAVFCDDIRVEASGKFTFVGVYLNTLFFYAPPPWQLPQFHIYVSVREPSPRPDPVLNFELRAATERGEQVVWQTQSGIDLAPSQTIAPFPFEHDMPLHIQTGFRLGFSPFKIEEDTRFTIVGNIDGREFFVDRLRIQQNPASMVHDTPLWGGLLGRRALGTLARTGEVCPESGLWTVVGGSGYAMPISKGNLMPPYQNIPATWSLAAHIPPEQLTSPFKLR